MEQNYLTHWGIKGMKWGVRRFQNKDGSLTPAGRKRYGDDDVGSSDKKVKKALKKGSLSDLSDEDLIKAINRARLEDTYRALRPEQVSTGKKFAQKVMDDIIVPTAKSAGQNFMNKQLDKVMDKVLGVKPDELAALKKEFDILDYKSKIDEIKTGKPRAKNWEEMKKKQEWEKGEKDATTKSDDSSNKSSNKSKNEDSDRKVYEGTVEGEGTSRRKAESSTKSNTSYDTIYDVDWTDVTPSNVPAKYTSAGESFVAALLEPPKDQ